MLLALLQPIPEIRRHLEESVNKLKTYGKTLVGLHIRRGDFVDNLTDQRFELMIPIEHYRKWLRAIWPTLDTPVLFIATEDHSIAQQFSDFSPHTAREIGATMPSNVTAMTLSPAQCQTDTSFFPDWYMLTMSDVLVTSNSTFSFSAALLNSRARLFIRPTFTYDLVSFEPWQSEPLLFLDSPKSLFSDLANRVRLDLKNSGCRHAPSAIRRAITLLKSVIATRFQANFRKSGWRGMIKSSFNLQLYISFNYKV
jgi:hypothetical protein